MRPDKLRHAPRIVKFTWHHAAVIMSQIVSAQARGTGSGGNQHREHDVDVVGHLTTTVVIVTVALTLLALAFGTLFLCKGAAKTFAESAVRRVRRRPRTTTESSLSDADIPGASSMYFPYSADATDVAQDDVEIVEESSNIEEATLEFRSNSCPGTTVLSVPRDHSKRTRGSCDDSEIRTVTANNRYTAEGGDARSSYERQGLDRIWK